MTTQPLIEGTATATEAEILKAYRARAEPATIESEAEAAIDRLAAARARQDGVSIAKAYDATVTSPIGAQLYGIARGKVPVIDEQVTLAHIRSLGR